MTSLEMREKVADCLTSMLDSLGTSPFDDNVQIDDKDGFRNSISCILDLLNLVIEVDDHASEVVLNYDTSCYKQLTAPIPDLEEGN